MSFVTDQVRRIDVQLDRLQLSSAAATASIPGDDRVDLQDAQPRDLTDRAKKLLNVLKSLSPSPAARSALIPLYTVHAALEQTQSGKASIASADTPTEASSYEQELEWLVISKATTQTYGRLLDIILNQTIPLSQDIDYWDSILNSYRYTALYSAQTSPLRLYAFSQEVYQDVKARGGSAAEDGWRQFYGLVKQVVRERNLADVRQRVISPVTRVRAECRRKKVELKKIRLMNANALGVLLGEGLSNQSVHEKGLATPAEVEGQEAPMNQWKSAVLRNIGLMDAVLQSVSDHETTVDTFDHAVSSATDEDNLFQLGAKEGSDSIAIETDEAVQRLRAILDDRLPTYRSTFAKQVEQHGRPSRLIRWWLPMTVAILSSGTILRMVANRRAEILTWVQEFGITVRDFWANWVVEPTRRLIGTIRHDEGSEISIMSKRSLEGDRDSLERMVVDFAVKNPDNGSLTDAQITEIREKVKEGDLTPVLKAYEKDMQSPFKGALRGNLIQALLIQVQKTKVDVEIAMGGIDGMLKSQELLFGLIGLTPGLLISVFLGRWLYSTFGSRQTIAQGRQAGQLLRELRNIDRILTTACPTDFGELLYKDQGLLLCEVHLLRQDAEKVMPSQVYRDFIEDIDDLTDVRMGLAKQQKTVERIRWAYRRWLR